MAQRSRLLDILQGAAPMGAGPAVGTDAIPTGELEASTAPVPMPGEEGPMPGAPGVEADMTPDQEAQVQAELALAARESLMERLRYGR